MSINNSKFFFYVYYSSNALGPGDNFLTVLTESLSDRTFIQDYQKFYPIENDLEILRQACPELDDFKMNFVLQGVAGTNPYTLPGELLVPTTNGFHYEGMNEGMFSNNFH